MTLSYRPRVRLNAEIYGPLRSMNDYQFGFYDTGFLRQAVQALSEQHSTEKPVSFRMATLPIPQTPSELRIAEAIVRHPQISYAIVDKDKMAFVIIEGCPGWLEAFKRLGYEVYAGDKTAKRLKTFHRPALLNATFAKDELNVMIVDPTQYSEYNFNDPEMLASLSAGLPGCGFQGSKSSCPFVGRWFRRIFKVDTACCSQLAGIRTLKDHRHQRVLLRLADSQEAGTQSLEPESIQCPHRVR